MATADSRPLRVLLSAIVLLHVSACTSGAAATPAAPRRSDAPTPSAPATAGFCKVDLPAGWRQALTAGRVERRDDEALQIVAAAGGTLFADSFLDGARSVVRIRGGERTTVLRLADEDAQVSDAAFDGRWLVFSVQEQPGAGGAAGFYAWDSTAGRPAHSIGRSSADGGPAPGVVLLHGHAFWTAAVSGTASRLHMTDLATGRDSVLRDGTPGGPFRFGDLVGWTETDPRDGGVLLAAADAGTGAAVPLPPELAGPVALPAVVNGDEQSFVWTAGQRLLRVWRKGAPAPTTVMARPPAGSRVEWPSITGDLVGWDDGDAMLVADLRSRSYTQVTPAAGSVAARDGYLIVGSASADKARHPIHDWAVVRSADLPPLPGC